MYKPSLNALFEDDLFTELANIANETPSGLTITDRVGLWIRQSERNIYIGRGSPWGNPYSHLDYGAGQWKVETRDEAIDKYREYILTRPDLLETLGTLKGKRLGCWCAPLRCHGTILLSLLWDL